MPSDTESEYGASRAQGKYNTLPGQDKFQAVVISVRDSHMILQHEKINDSQYFMMTNRSTNVKGNQFPRMREYVEILASEPIRGGDNSMQNPGELITRFSYKPPEMDFIKREIFAVAQVAKHYLIVVGGSLMPMTFLCIPATKEYKPGQLLVGDLVWLPRLVALKTTPDDAFFVKDLEHERKVRRRQDQHQHDRLVYAENVRALTEEEEGHILRRCMDIKDLSLEQAKLYIQDAHVAVGCLEQYYQVAEVREHCVQVHHERMGISPKPTLCFYLDDVTYKKCFRSNSTAAWKRGSELQIAHTKLRYGGRDQVAILTIRNIKKDRNGHLIELVATNASDTELKAAFKYPKDFIQEPFVICPVYEENQAVLPTIMADFDGFFGRELFNFYSGRLPNSYEDEVPNIDQPFFVNEKPLDDSQLEFMRCAAVIPGFTCAQAPPGCGKTHSTAALVAHLCELETEGGICISGTTNAAVTNACDAVNRGFPQLKVIRDYSRKAVADVSEDSKLTSLNHMSQEPQKHVNMEKNGKLQDTWDNFQEAKENAGKQASSLRQQMNSVAVLKKEELDLKKTFLHVYAPRIFGTTVEKLIRQGDIFAEGDGQAREQSSLARLILDEAAAMSPIEALALYCKFPFLTHITLLGDMKQLGPHCTLPEGSMARKLVAEGELTRMFQLQSTTKRDLNTIYRCHPKITEKFLIPIYGEQMKAGVAAEARNLGLEKGLPMAEDGSPCLLINVDGHSEGGVNEGELRLLQDLVHDLKDKGVSMDDVVVLCHHNAQRGRVVDIYAEKGSHGELKTLMRIHTVDSFQGKEAKVIILLTTKTCSGGEAEDALQRLGFVSNPSRGTVAVSRAQHVLYILGNFLSLSRTPFWQKFIPAMIEAGGVVDRSYYPCDEVIAKLRRTLQMKKVFKKKRPISPPTPEPSEPSGNEASVGSSPESLPRPAESVVYEVVNLVEEFMVNQTPAASCLPPGDLINF